MKKLLDLEKALNAQFVEREDVVRSLLLGVLTGQHVLWTGTHGTAKSMIASAFFGAFSKARVFATQMTKQMVEDAIIGPPNLKKMREEGKIEYVVDSMAPEADLLYLEEFFDANEGVLRSMLSILNERIFQRGPQRVECPLHMAVATSNFFREEEEVAAVTDRFLIRVKVAPISAMDNIKVMLKNYVDGREPTIPMLTRGDLDDAVKDMRAVKVPAAMLDAYVDLMQECILASGGNLVVSDRRRCWALDLARAHAVLEGRKGVEADDLEACAFGLVVVGTDQEDWFDAAYKKVIGSRAAKEQYADLLAFFAQSVQQMSNRVGKFPTKGAANAAIVIVRDAKLLVQSIEAKANELSNSPVVDEVKKHLADARKVQEKAVNAYQAAYIKSA